ncbi:MAG: hypothetical protein ACHQAR_01470 [Steroidobacterales bacterium]
MVIFLRSPRPTLSSLLAMRPGPGEVARTEHRACDYYVARLQRLRVEGEQLQQRALYFDAEAIVTRPEIVLGTLQAWLGLRTPLITSYRLFPKSGHVGYGDPGENILAGRVLDPAEPVHISAPLSPTVIAEAEAAYSRCRDVLQRSCRSLTEFSAQRWNRNAASLAAGARAPGGDLTPLRA